MARRKAPAIEMKRCNGYTSPAGDYAQEPHEVALTAENFHRAKTKSGFWPRCKVCENRYQADWRARKVAKGQPEQAGVATA